MDQWNEPIDEPELVDRQSDENTSGVDPGWKDELNLAEFPIAALTDRIPHGQTTLVFEDQLQRRDNTLIVRRLTIMGTHKHGLPTSLDDEVLVGLIQLTKRRNGFTDARVQFSRYELIELLGWPQSGQSYRRIEEALHRWVGVVLMYENAWWDNQAKSWVDEQFHVLDNVTLYDRERWRTSVRSAKSAKGDRSGSKTEKLPLPLSSFRWNEVIFRSFQSGNLKQLDLEFYLKLRLPTTKRMYRFLDKRFYRRSRLEFDLRTFACEHIGLSRTYAPTELKRRLKPALEEMEQLGFLEPLSPPERYSYVRRGCWRIIFIRGGRANTADQDARAESQEHPSELVNALKARGVTGKIAQDLVDSLPPVRICTKIKVFDWLLRNDDKRIGKNPAGYLVASIRSDYQMPGDYPGQASKFKLVGGETMGLNADPRSPQGQQQTGAEIQAQCDKIREEKLRAAWNLLPESQREAIRAVVRSENPGLGRWKNMLEPLCLSVLESQMNETRTHGGQQLLFSDTDPAD